MKPLFRNERGQALILVVFAIFGLLALTALTIDGGNAYSDKRHAQNAADTAALAAARAKVRADINWVNAGEAIASENGYTDNGATVTVYVLSCDDHDGNPPDAYCDLPSGTDESGYVQVQITSTIRTYFARVIGVEHITNHVDAVAKARPEDINPNTFGQALISLMPGCKGESSWPHDPFVVGGNSVNIIGGSGVFVNSNCSGAYDQSGSSGVTIVDLDGDGQPDGDICVVGGADYTSGTTPPPTANCGGHMDNPLSVIQWPNLQDYCENDAPNGSITEVPDSNHIYYAEPGVYNSDFPDATPAGKLYIKRGIYCIMGGADFKLNSTWTITTDLNDSGTQEANEGALFYLEQGGVSLNGSSTLVLNALIHFYPDDPAVTPLHILFYLPVGNTSTVSMNGGSGSYFSGSIVAPSGHVILNGNTDGYTVNSQIMGYTIATAGTGSITLNYNNSDNYTYTLQPEVELNK